MMEDINEYHITSCMYPLKMVKIRTLCIEGSSMYLGLNKFVSSRTHQVSEEGRKIKFLPIIMQHFCMIMHAIDPVLFSFLSHLITQARVKFHFE